MITKEEFNSVWKDTSKEGILNQFYYEHLDLLKYISLLKEIRGFVFDTCYYPELENYSNMTSEEVLELMDILDKAIE